MIERGIATQYLVAVRATPSPGRNNGFTETVFGDFFGNKFGAVDVMVHLLQPMVYLGVNPWKSTGLVHIHLQPGRTNNTQPVPAPSASQRRLKRGWLYLMPAPLRFAV